MIRYEDVIDMNFFNIINDIISEKLYYMEGENIYGCDLASRIYGSDNTNGVFILGTEDAKRFIGEHFAVAADTVDYFEEMMGCEIYNPNPFKSPEAFTVYMEIYGVETQLNKSALVLDNWDEEITFTPEVIAQIKKEIGIPLEQLEPEKSKSL